MIYVNFIFLLISTNAVFSNSDNSPEEALIPILFDPPSVDTDSANFVELFNSKNVIGTKWIKSKSKKEGVDDVISKYDGEWIIDAPEKIAFDGDFQLVAKSTARHHAISSNLKKPFKFSNSPLIIQYEVRYSEGQECGGGYLKLLSSNEVKDLANFNDKSSYIIMFGPDKCGFNAKVHMILRFRNPKNGTVSEHHSKQPSKTIAQYFDDKMSHLFTLVIRPDNNYKVMIDHNEIMSGNILQDLEPPIIPPKEIFDPEDVKPKEWDDREMIEDVNAVKPDDWDENQPKDIVDTDAVKPSDWLEDVHLLIVDPESKKPNDWDDEMDGEWEPKKISNPDCSGKSGCGPWIPPTKANPLYKGKWIRPKVKNSQYKGKWTPRLIENPNYFEANPFEQLESIGAIGIELWTMSPNIHFDNMLLCNDEQLASDFSAQTFDLKFAREKEIERASNPSAALGFVRRILNNFLEATEEKPWLWVVAIFAVLVPIVAISALCFGRRTNKVDSKKSDEVLADDAGQDDEFEQVEMDNIDGENVVSLLDENFSKNTASNSADVQTLNSTSSQSSPSRNSSRRSSAASKPSTPSMQQKKVIRQPSVEIIASTSTEFATHGESKQSDEPEKKSPRQRRVRARRQE